MKILRARNSQDKAARFEKILDQSLQLFRDREIESISMESLAKKVGLAKGTLYLYFQSKEEVFLGATKKLLETWSQTVADEFSQVKQPLSAAQFSKLFISTLKKQPELPRLLSSLHVILEKNISDEAALDFKLDLKKILLNLSATLEHKTLALQGAQGTSFLMKSYGMVVGLYQTCNPNPQIQKIIQHPDLQIFKMDFYEQLEQGLTLLLLGFENIKSLDTNSYHLFQNY